MEPFKKYFLVFSFLSVSKTIFAEYIDCSPTDFSIEYTSLDRPFLREVHVTDFEMGVEFDRDTAAVLVQKQNDQMADFLIYKSTSKFSGRACTSEAAPSQYEEIKHFCDKNTATTIIEGTGKIKDGKLDSCKIGVRELPDSVMTRRIPKVLRRRAFAEIELCLESKLCPALGTVTDDDLAYGHRRSKDFNFYERHVRKIDHIYGNSGKPGQSNGSTARPSISSESKSSESSDSENELQRSPSFWAAARFVTNLVKKSSSIHDFGRESQALIKKKFSKKQQKTERAGKSEDSESSDSDSWIMT